MLQQQRILRRCLFSGAGFHARQFSSSPAASPASHETRRVAGRGRGLFALRALSAGERLGVFPPLVAVADAASEPLACGHCFRAAGAYLRGGVPCAGGCGAVYCGRACADAADSATEASPPPDSRRLAMTATKPAAPAARGADRRAAALAATNEVAGGGGAT
jgi:hypothetical protein